MSNPNPNDAGRQASGFGMKSFGTALGLVLLLSTSASAGSYYLHYTLTSGVRGVQGGYSSYESCMKAGNGSASFASRIETFFCSGEP